MAYIYDLLDTWNNANTIFTAIKMNVTDTSSNASSLLMDLQIGGVSKFSVDKLGYIRPSSGYVIGNGFAPDSSGNRTLVVNSNGTQIRSTSYFAWGSASSDAGGVPDLVLTRKSAANLQLGAADAAAPIGQSLGVQSVVAGTANTAGPDFYIKGSQSTGNAAGGNIVFQLASAGTGANTSQNPLATALTIYSSDKSVTFIGNIVAPGGTINGLGFDNQSGWRRIWDGQGGATGLQFYSSNPNGQIVFNGYTSIGFVPQAWPVGTPDAIISRKGANNIRLGAADAALANGQNLSVQSVVSGTANTAGPDFYIQGSQSTGNANGGSIIFQVSSAGTGANTSQNPLATALTINSVRDAVFASSVKANTVVTNGDYYLGVGLAGGGVQHPAYWASGTNGSLGATGGAFVLGANRDLCWSSADYNPLVSVDIRLIRDAANTLAQRNGTANQTFRLYGTYTDASNYSRLSIAHTGSFINIFTQWAGTGTESPIQIGYASSNIRISNYLALLQNMSLQFYPDNSYDIGAVSSNRPRHLYVAGSIYGAGGGSAIFKFGQIVAEATGYIGFANRSYISSNADGILFLQNSAGTDFNRLQFGGTTSAFPALKRGTTDIQVRLADDSADAPLSASSLTATSNSNNTSVLSSTGYLLTGSSAVSMIDLAGTWNTTGIPTALKLNITDTASNTSSLLMDLQVGGSSKFSVTKAGAVSVSSLIVPTNGTITSSAGDVRLVSFNGNIALGTAEGRTGLLGNRFIISSLEFTAGAWYVGGDLKLERDSANTLAQRNGTASQTFRIYNTYTDASNYERGKIAWEGNVLRIGTEKAGTGTARDIEFQVNGTTLLTLSTSSISSFGGSVSINDLGSLFWQNRSVLQSPSNGIITLYNRAQTDFSRLQLGGTSNTFPAIKRANTDIQIRLADDTAYTTIDAQHRLQGTAPASNSAFGVAGDIRYDSGYIYICTAANTWVRAAVSTW